MIPLPREFESNLTRRPAVGNIAPSPAKRDVVGSTVGDVAGTVGSVANPVLSPVLDTVGSVAPVKRDLQILNSAGSVVNTAEMTATQLLQGLQSGKSWFQIRKEVIEPLN